MSNNFKEKLKLVEYWIREYPHNLRKVPENININQKDAMLLQKLYRERGGNISLIGLKELRKDILERIGKEISFLDRIKKPLEIFLIVLGLFSPLFFPYIFQTFDTMQGKFPDVYISLQKVSVIRNEQFLNLSDIKKRKNYIDQLVSDRIKNNLSIPPYSEDSIITVFDPKTNQRDCFIHFIINEDNKQKLVGFTAPEMELNNLSDGSLPIILYGKNLGKKDIDSLSVKICLSDEVYVEKNIEFILNKDSNCVILKKSGIISEESFLGSLILRRYDNSLKFNNTIFKEIKGKYDVWGLESEVSPDHIGNVVSEFILNCSTS